MRVLVAHNLYRSATPSGENDLVRAEIDLLTDGGVEVAPLLTDSDDIAPGLRAALTAAPGPLSSRSWVRRVNSLVRFFQPVGVPGHNGFPPISPWGVRGAAPAGLP